MAKSAVALIPPDQPEALTTAAQRAVACYVERHGEAAQWLLAALGDEPFARHLTRAWGGSTFVATACLQRSALLKQLLDSGDLYRPRYGEGSQGGGSYCQRLTTALTDVADEAELQRVLRQFRQREVVRILWRDFNRLATTLDTTRDMTLLAEACIEGALNVLSPLLTTEFGVPHGRNNGTPQQLVVLAMGKMGAWELNVSSDIDLIFAFPDSGETAGGPRQCSNQEFFTTLGQKLIQALDNKTVDGFVFRVDMRLRPYGQSGALVLNFDALEDYYQTQGRDWERYAMVKARVVAGERAAGERLMAILRPFTYRKYIDYSAIQALRNMKGMINREVRRRGMDRDIKKGAGGIREVEFIAQAFQLIRGGKDVRFQRPELGVILTLLKDEGLLPAGVAGELWRAYRFLRDTEHVLQGHQDQQTQQLPECAATRAVVAELMGFTDWSVFVDQLAVHRALVRNIFADIVSQPVGGTEETDAVLAARALWLAADAEVIATELSCLGFTTGSELAHELLTLRQSRSVKSMESSVRNRLETFMPLLIVACSERSDSDETLRRILPLVQAVVRRSIYLVLLIENPEALRQLVRLCAESRWIAEQISHYPALLDELLDSHTLYTPADKASIAQDLHQQVLRIASDDLEAQMDVLRYFRRAQGLRVAACEVTGTLPLMKISDNLTWLAEAILEHVLALAWEWVVARHGHPGRQPGEPVPGLLIVGYGKLGGIELAHGSDLDLVFIHNADSNLTSDGVKAIDNATYFMRLGQRMIHILTTHTVSGGLYDVDMRLRPDGESGMLVIGINAFARYQTDKAWTWEHQALVRARPIAGDLAMAGDFDAVRQNVLCRFRQPEALRQEVLAMRKKMRSHLSPRGAVTGSDEVFHIKQGQGGIVDIEFIVQYLALQHAADYPAVVKYTDNMRMLDAIRDCGLLPAASVAELQNAYIFFRSLGHRFNLQGKKSRIDGTSPYWSEACQYSAQVSDIWQQAFGVE